MYTTVLVITDNKTLSMALYPKEAKELDLKLKVTSEGRSWVSVSDALFAVGAYHANAVTRLVVTAEQFQFLKKLYEQIGYDSLKMK